MEGAAAGKAMAVAWAAERAAAATEVRVEDTAAGLAATVEVGFGVAVAARAAR